MPVLLAHAVLLVVATVFVVWDAGGPFGADTLVTAIVPMLAVVVAGAVRAARGVAGAKPLLAGADLGIAALAGATWLLSDSAVRRAAGLALRRDPRRRDRAGRIDAGPSGRLRSRHRT